MKLLTTLLCVLAVTSRAASNYLAADFLVVSNAVVNWVNGDTNIVAPGTVYWSNSISFPANSYGMFGGSGTNVTKFISNAGLGSCLTLPSTPAGRLMVIGFFDADGVSANGSGWLSWGGNLPSTKVAGSFMFTQIQMTNVISRALSGGGGDFFGVIDHCRFKAPTGAGNFNHISFFGNEYYSWTNSNPLGTTNMIVVENCEFDTVGGVGNGHWDAYNGASYCVRYSVIDHPANTGSHGYDSQITSARVREIYANTWSNQVLSSYITEDRGGTIVCFSNRIFGTTALTNGFLLKYYRACNGAYQSGLGYPGYWFTNKFSGTASSGTATVLTDNTQSGGTLSPIHYASEHIGRLLKLVSGTGAGQSLTISANTINTITVSGGTFSPAPDATTGYEIWFQDGNTASIANQPAYTFKTTITGGNNVNRYVKLGASMQESLTNLYQCINLDPAGAGLNYAQTTTNTVSGRQLDMQAVGILANTLLLTNILDGNGDFGWPAAQQFGVWQTPKYTNSPVAIYPCYQWSNTCNGSNMAWSLAFDASSCNNLNYVTNLLKPGRDYVNSGQATNYTPLVYPHPLVTAFYGQQAAPVEPPKMVVNNLYLR